MMTKRDPAGARPCRFIVALLALLVLAAAAVCAAEGTAPPQPAAPIPLAAVGLRAESTERRLREIELRLRPSAELTALPASLALFQDRAQAQSTETTRLLEAASIFRVFSLESERWHTLRQQTEEWSRMLEARTAQLEDAGTAVDGLHATWVATRDAASAADVPSAISERIEATLADIATVRRAIADAQAALLMLEDRVAHERAVCDEALARVDVARGGFATRLFGADRPPLWLSLRRPGAWMQASPRLPNSARASLLALRSHLQQYARWLGSELAGLVFLAVLLERMRRRRRCWVERHDDVPAVMDVLDRPYSSALFVVALVGWLTHQLAPQGQQAILMLCLLGTLVRLLPMVLPPAIRPLVLAIIGVSLIVRMLGIMNVQPLFEQLWLVLAALLISTICAWFWVAGARSRTVPPRGTDRLAWVERVRLVAGVLGTVAAGSLVAGALGYVPLARLAAWLVVGSFVLAVGLLVLVRIIEAVLAFLLRVWPLRLLETVQRHRPAIESRLRRVLVVVAAITWAASVLEEVSLREPLWNIIVTILEARAGGGSVSISLGDVLSVVVTVWVAFRLSALLRLVLSEDILPHLATPRGASTALPSLLHYFILTVAFFICVAMLGIDLTRVTILAGAFGVGIGFGLQDVVNNFAAGAILLVERPIQSGDTVQVGELVATVHRIGLRSSTLRTGEGAEVIVPNSKLVTSELTNWTLSDRTRRIEVPVVVAYGNDPERVLDVLRGVLANHPGVLRTPAPAALLSGFGAGGLTFSLSAWVGVFEQWRDVRSDLALSVHKALAREGIKVTG